MSDDIVERLRELNTTAFGRLMNEAADEIDRLRSWQDQHDCCMCGSRMSDHDIGSGHSPVSMYDYYQSQLEQRAEAAEAKLATAVKALERYALGYCGEDTARAALAAQGKEKTHEPG
jgi:hypothetical protein